MAERHYRNARPLHEWMGMPWESSHPLITPILYLTCRDNDVVVIQDMSDGRMEDLHDMRITRIEQAPATNPGYYGPFRDILYQPVGKDSRPFPELGRRARVSHFWTPGIDGPEAPRYRGGITCPMPDCRDFVPFRAEKLFTVVTILVGQGVDRLPLVDLPSWLHEVSRS